MKSVLLALLLSILLFEVQATTIQVFNYCGQSFPLWKSDNGGGSYALATIAPGKSYTFSGVGAFNLKGGQQGKTLAEFSCNAGGRDWFDVSRIVGYDYPIVINAPTNTGDSACYDGVCKSPSCSAPQAYATNAPDQQTATHSCVTGKTFKVLFCG